MAANYDKEFFAYLEKNYPAIHPNSAFGKEMLDIFDAAIKMMEEKFTSTNNDYAAALLRIRNIVRDRGDSVTKMGKVSDVFAGLNLPKAEDCA
jgi:hypothetical protein